MMALRNERKIALILERLETILSLNYLYSKNKNNKI